MTVQKKLIRQVIFRFGGHNSTEKLLFAEHKASIWYYIGPTDMFLWKLELANITENTGVYTSTVLLEKYLKPDLILIWYMICLMSMCNVVRQ